MSSRLSNASSSSSSSATNNSSSRDIWQSARYTLFLRVHSGDKMTLATSFESYCKLYLGTTPVVNSNLTKILSSDKPAKKGDDSHRTFLTKVFKSQQKMTAVWNEKFEIPVENPQKEILSIRVKSQHPIYCPAIGSCAIQLKQLKLGQTVDQAFPLFKGSSQVGAIRLQLMVRENHDGHGNVPVAKRVSSSMHSEEASMMMKKNKSKNKMPPPVPQKLQVDEYDHEEYDEREYRQRDSMLALERERRRIEEEEKDRMRKQREHEQQLAMEKQRIEEQMEKLRYEDEERKRVRLEEENEHERRAAVEKEQQEELRKRRQWQLEEEALVNQQQHEQHDQPRRKSSALDNQSSDDQHKLMTQKHSKDEYDDTMANKNRRSGGRRRSTLSMQEMIDMVVHDALPSDSEASESEELDTEDEQELIRKVTKLKIQMKKKKKEARARMSMSMGMSMGSQPQQPVEVMMKEPKKKTSSAQKVVVIHHQHDSDSEDDHHQYQQQHRYKDKHSRSSPSFSSDLYGGHYQEPGMAMNDPNKKMKKDKKHSKSQGDMVHRKSRSGSNDYDNGGSGKIKSLTPGKISKKTGVAQDDAVSLGQMCNVASSVAVLAANDGEDASGFLPDAADVVQSLIPIGRFLGRKIHEASAKVAQMNEKETPSYYF